MKKVFTIVFAALLACTFAFVGCGQSGDSTEVKTGKKDSPSAVIEKCLNLLKSKDYKGSMQYLEGIEDATEDDVESLVALVSAIYEYNDGLKDYEIIDEQISEDGQSAIVNVKYTFGNGEISEDTEEMVLTEKGWKMKM